MINKYYSNDFKKVSNDYRKVSDDLFSSLFTTNKDDIEVPVEVFIEEDRFMINFYLVNVDKNAVHIDIENGDTLCIRFHRLIPEFKPSLSNLKYGDLKCGVKIPALNRINNEHISAVHKDGILTVTILKNQSPSKIIIK